MAEYCESSDIEKRLTTAGFKWVADRNKNATVDQDEIDNFITTGIVYAGSLIDGALARFLSPEMSRAAGNQWLKDRCIDIATYRAVKNGGREVPESVQLDYEFSWELIQQVGKGEYIVPGLTYPLPDGATTRRTMAIYNLRGAPR